MVKEPVSNFSGRQGNRILLFEIFCWQLQFPIFVRERVKVLDRVGSQTRIAEMRVAVNSTILPGPAVTHPSTDRAQRCLTLVILGELLCPTCYGPLYSFYKEEDNNLDQGKKPK